MKLTDNAIRDINRYLEEGKPLPEKYRVWPLRILIKRQKVYPYF
jgi:hypothetical protein